MELYKSLGLDLNEKQVISIVGGGGKTTTMNKLATELKEKGKKVLVTTSTCMMMPKEEEYDRIINLEDIKKNEEIMKKNLQKGSITVIFGEILRIDKIKGLEEETIDYIFNEDIFDFIIVEADGARRRPIKAPREGEPLIPSSTGSVIGLIGLDSYGKKINEDTIHRIEIFREILNIEDEEYIDENIIANLVVNTKGLFKNSDDKDKYLILNKADDLFRQEAGKKIKEKIPKTFELKKILITSYLKDVVIE